MMDSNARPDSGFTLIEAIVALAIAGLGLTSLFLAAGEGLRGTRGAQESMMALDHAQSHLAALGTLIALTPGRQSGRDDDTFSWRADLSPIAVVRPAEKGSVPWILYDVKIGEIWVRAARRHEVTLETYKIGQGERVH
jgi:general secretion pathway protein I